MQQIVKIVGMLSLVWLLAGCQGEPTFDTTSEETIEASVKMMVAELSGKKKEKFKESIAGIYMIGSLKGTMEGKDEKAVLNDINRKLDGMTTGEIIAFANKIKEEMKNR